MRLSKPFKLVVFLLPAVIALATYASFHDKLYQAASHFLSTGSGYRMPMDIRQLLDLADELKRTQRLSSISAQPNALDLAFLREKLASIHTMYDYTPRADSLLIEQAYQHLRDVEPTATVVTLNQLSKRSLIESRSSNPSPQSDLNDASNGLPSPVLTTNGIPNQYFVNPNNTDDNNAPVKNQEPPHNTVPLPSSRDLLLTCLVAILALITIRLSKCRSS